MKGLNEFSIIEIRLPKHLVEWLDEFSKQIAMKPDQLIANILTYYYEAWKVGFERGKEALSRDTIKRELTEETPKADIEKLAEVFIQNINNKNKYIVKRFASWVKENNIPISSISEDNIRSFLNDYQRTHNINKNTYYNYRQVLKKFVKYVQNSLTQASEDRGLK